MDDLEKELKVGFLEEASQLLADAEQCFLSLETNPEDPAIVDQIFRLAHNLKGSAKAVGFEQMGGFAHQFESLLLKVKKGELAATSGVVSTLLRCNDHIREMVETLKGNLSAVFNSEHLLQEIADQMSGKSAPESEAGSAVSNQGVAEAHPVPTATLAAPKPSSPSAPATAAAEETVRVNINRLEKLLNFVGEMVILQTVLREQASGTSPLVRRTVDQLGKVTKEIQDISMSLRMLPLKPVFQKMQRIVRDTAQTLNKKIEFKMGGEDTEVDKTVLENLSDPLVHLIRNAVDHGIESGEKRLQAGKSEVGHIELRAFHESGRLIIEVKDDGGGIDPAVLRKKAVEKGILSPGATISDHEAIHLIFHPGFSTKQETTDVSGRGVGMDVVRSNIERMQGEVEVDTKVGEGTRFRITLPLTLAIIDAMVIRAGDERFVIPLYQVHESLRPSPKDVQYNIGLGETLLLRGENLPLFRLDGLVKRRESPPVGDSIAIVVRTEKQPFAILVDDIVGQQQVVIKKLGSEIQNLPTFSGCAILGDGRPVLILELAQIVKLQSGQGRLERRLSA